jgi:DNA-directed RNA polymerase specialized sigma24 family protein
MDDSSANQTDPVGVDWSMLYKRLSLCATSWFRGEGCFDDDSVLPNTGMSARDLVSNTILNLMKEDQLRSVSASGDLFPFAFRMMRNDFLDLVKSAEYKQTLITESISGEHKQSLMASLSSTHDVMENAEVAALVNSLKASLDLNEMEKSFLDVWLVKRVAKREDIAYILGVRKQEATNIKRKLVYKLKPFMSSDFDAQQ